MKNATNPEQALSYLSERLRTTLALLHRGSDQLEPLILATLPRGSRLVLLTLDAVEPVPNAPSELRLTAFGKELSACCAVGGLSPELQQKLMALEQEQAQTSVDHEDGSRRDSGHLARGGGGC